MTSAFIFLSLHDEGRRQISQQCHIHISKKPFLRPSSVALIAQLRTQLLILPLLPTS